MPTIAAMITFPKNNIPGLGRYSGDKRHQHQVQTRCHNNHDDETVAVVVVAKRPAPRMGCFANNHVLVNQERSKRNLKPYIRSPFLDSLAKKHAEQMASESKVRHSVKSIDELRFKLGGAEHVAENVQVGESIVDMHDATMGRYGNHNKVSCQNILGNFEQFGMATAKGKDGQLYMCQLFLAP